MKRKKGYIAIMTVLALLVFSLALSLAVTYLSIGEAQSALALARGEAALQATEGCAQDALLLIIRDENYTGGEYTYLGTDCTVSIDRNDPIWTVDVSGTKDAFTRNLRVTVERVPSIPASLILKSWLEQ